jgi:NADH dehydrogenase
VKLQQNDVIGLKDVYAIGDCALMLSEDKPHGDPQVAQVAIQQAVTLAKNLKAELILKDPTPLYKDMGSMATIGRKKAIAEIFGLRFNGFLLGLPGYLSI